MRTTRFTALHIAVGVIAFAFTTFASAAPRESPSTSAESGIIPALYTASAPAMTSDFIQVRQRHSRCHRHPNGKRHCGTHRRGRR
jgi:hypothetical protein